MEPLENHCSRPKQIIPQFPFHSLHTYWHIKTSWGKYVSDKCHGWKSKHEAADYYRVKLKCLSFPPQPPQKNKFGRKFRCISLSLLEKAIRVISFHIKVKLQDSAVILTRTWPCSWPLATQYSGTWRHWYHLPQQCIWKSIFHWQGLHVCSKYFCRT